MNYHKFYKENYKKTKCCLPPKLQIQINGFERSHMSLNVHQNFVDIYYAAEQPCD